jgi:ATP-binding cassette subfamily B protein/subfamily B ATP-binding cassette protein MsbA
MISFPIARRVLNCTRSYRWQLLALLGQIFVLSGLEVLKPWPLKLVVDNAISGKPLSLPEWVPWGSSISNWAPLVLVAAACTGLLVIYAATAALTLVYNWVAIGLGQRMVHELRMRVYGHLQRLSLTFHNRQTIGDLMMRVTADTFAVQTIIMNSFLPIVQAALLLSGMVLILFSINPMLTLISLSVASVMSLIMLLFNRWIDIAAVVARNADSQVYSLVNWGIKAIKHIQAFTNEEHEHRRFMQASGAALHSHRLLYAWQGIYAQGVNLLIGTGTALVIFVGAREVLLGRLSLGELLVFAAYVTQLYAPVNQLAQSFGTIRSARAGASRCFEILESEQPLENGTRLFPPEGSKGRIEWRGVSFQYRRDTPMLRGINFTVEPGQTIALVGATGAGKSTLLSLLPRFFDPTAGQVLVDGVDIREYQLKSLRNQIAMVLQPPLVFPLSVRDNIAYGRHDATLADIQHVARLACIEELTGRLPHGYDSIIEETGFTLSEGERQRLSIARALLRNAPILIFDEPTSALDAQTEVRIMQALRQLGRNRTTLIIAHRLSTVRQADNILVLQDGRIVESGSFPELMEQDGVFSGLY